MSDFRDAVRVTTGRELEAQLVCPQCGAANKRGATIIERETPTVARCSCCTKTFNPQEQEKRP